MNIANCYSLIDIGLLVRYLISVRKGFKASTICESIDRLSNTLEELGFVVSHAALNRLDDITNSKIAMIGLKDEELKDDKLIADFKEQMNGIEAIIISEATTKTIYNIPQRRFNENFLLNHPEKLLKEGVFGKLSDMAKFDFGSSCRCLCFGEGTAVAFHVLRATEEVLRQYYFKYKKTKRLAKPMWGPMTAELRMKKGPKPKEDILATLDLVRTSYRNPTQHPLAKYDIDSGQDLFGICIDLINRMGNDLD